MKKTKQAYIDELEAKIEMLKIQLNSQRKTIQAQSELLDAYKKVCFNKKDAENIIELLKKAINQS